MSKVIKETVKTIIKSAETPELIRLALTKCTKAEMVEVYEELSGRKYPKKISGERKAELVSNICKLWKQAQDEAEFQSKSLEEKLAVMKAFSRETRPAYIKLCTDAELESIAEELGILADVKGMRESLQYAVMKEIAVQEEISRIEGILSGNDGALVISELSIAQEATLERLMVKNGLKVSREDLPPKLRMVEELYKNYQAMQAKSKSVRVYEPESSEESYSDLAGADSASEQDILLERDADNTEISKRENSYGSKCLHSIVAEQTNMGRENLCETAEKREANLRPVDKSTFWLICSQTGVVGKSINSSQYYEKHGKEYLIRLCLFHKFPRNARKPEETNINCRKNYYPNIKKDTKGRRP